MVNGRRPDDGDDAVGSWSTSTTDVVDSTVGLTVEVTSTETGGQSAVDRQVTRGPRSDRLRSIGREGRARRSDCVTVG